jgi:hypothetical protein
MMPVTRGASRQQGIVLVIALIMLLAVTLMVVTSSNLVQSNLKIVQNVESREMARNAALAAIEEAISSPRFSKLGANIFVTSADTKLYDTNGDGTDDIEVVVAPPSCVSITPTPNSDLDLFGSAEEASCFLPPAIYSMCAYSVWDLKATATDVVTGAEVVVRQGVSILIALNEAESKCP